MLEELERDLRKPYTPCEVGEFYKVSKSNYENIIRLINEEEDASNNIRTNFVDYDDIIIPTRKTAGSAGYDFCLTQDVTLRMDHSLLIPTFIRCKIEPGWVLKIYPRSSCGFKFNMVLCNTVGIIDSDYYYSETDGKDNEGHIMIKIKNEGTHIMRMKAGERFCQGMLEMYGITYSDKNNKKEVRQGGIGSTGTV